MNVNKSNAQHGILFEAITLAMAVARDDELLASCVASLARFLTAKVRSGAVWWGWCVWWRVVCVVVCVVAAAFGGGWCVWWPVAAACGG